MRDLLLLLIILPGGLAAIRYPFVGAMLWTWVSIMNPHRLTWNFMYDAPVAMFVGLCTLIGLMTNRERRSPFQGAAACSCSSSRRAWCWWAGCA